MKYPVPKGLVNQRSNKEQIDLSLSRVESDLEPTKPMSIMLVVLGYANTYTKLGESH